MRFLSAEPRVRLTKAFATPFRNVVATARTCYSSRGIVEDSDVGEREKFAPLVRSIYEAGHHTTFQHAHFQFTLENVSRQFIWSFLHAHPFYNSEQVSQRYVAVQPDTVTVPDIPEPQLIIFRTTLERMFAAYRRLCVMLEGPVSAEYYRIFNRSARMEKRHQRAITKKAQEAARYVLPLATHAYLYHTISGITLLRYYRVARQLDLPGEQLFVAERMIEELLRFDPDYKTTLEEPLTEEELPEFEFLRSQQGIMRGERAAAFRSEFDAELGGLSSRLVSWPAAGERLIADAVREVLGLPRAEMADGDAVALALDPAKNRLLGESLNLTTMHKLTRAAYHAHFTFRKRLSHTADSQDQRHRMTPASRPILAAQVDAEPDFAIPGVIAGDKACLATYREVIHEAWEAVARLRTLGASPETVCYLLPNAVHVRFTESADLLNLRHKHEMRLCYNAQEEIWKASVEEARQIRDVLPGLGRYLLPPCGMRMNARQKPICPEGPRYCGIRVWLKDLADFSRVI